MENKQQKLTTQDKVNGMPINNPYQDKLSTVGMRIRQRLDQGYTSQLSHTAVPDNNSNTKLYAGLIVPQYRQPMMMQPPMLQTQDSSNCSNLDMFSTTETVNSYGKRSL